MHLLFHRPSSTVSQSTTLLPLMTTSAKPIPNHRSSEASSATLGSATGQSTIAFSDLPTSNHLESVEVEMSDQSARLADDVVVINGVKYVKAIKSYTTSSEFESQINTITQLVQENNLLKETYLKSVNDLGKQDKAALADCKRHSVVPQTALNVPVLDRTSDVYIEAAGDQVNQEPSPTELDSHVQPNDWKETPKEVLTSSFFPNRLFEVIVGDKQTHTSHFVHQPVLERLFPHDHQDHLVGYALEGNAIHIESDLDGFEDLLFFLYIRGLEEKNWIYNFLSQTASHNRSRLASLYFAASYFKLPNIKDLAIRLMPCDNSALNLVLDLESAYKSPLLDDQFRQYFKQSFASALKKTMAGDYDTPEMGGGWCPAYTPSKTDIRKLSVICSKGGKLAEDITYVILQENAPYNKQQWEEIPSWDETDNDIRTNDSEVGIDVCGPLKYVKFEDGREDGGDWNTHIQCTDADWTPAKDIKVDPYYCNACNWDDGHSDAQDTWSAAKPGVWADENEFAKTSKDGIGTGETQADIGSHYEKYTDSMPVQYSGSAFVPVPSPYMTPTGSGWAGESGHSTHRQGFSRVANRNSTSTTCSLRFRVGDLITNIFTINPAAHADGTMIGTCHGSRGIFPADFVSDQYSQQARSFTEPRRPSLCHRDCKVKLSTAEEVANSRGWGNGPSLAFQW